MPVASGASQIRFRNQHTVFENFVRCVVEADEFNLSYNPSLRQDPTDPNSELRSFATGSNFEPYVTTIGLYNDQGDLLMVAKLAKPILLSKDNDTTFLIRYDT